MNAVSPYRPAKLVLGKLVSVSTPGLRSDSRDPQTPPHPLKQVLQEGSRENLYSSDTPQVILMPSTHGEHLGATTPDQRHLFIFRASLPGSEDNRHFADTWSEYAYCFPRS